MAKKEKTIGSIAASIRRKMKEEGTYSPLYDEAINLLAETVFLRDRVYDDAVNYQYPEIDEVNGGQDRSIVVEQSREGFLRYKSNPAYALYLDYVDKELKILDALQMTPKSSSSIQEDEFDQLKEKMKRASDGER